MKTKNLILTTCAVGLLCAAPALATNDAPTADEMLARYERAAQIQNYEGNRWSLNELIFPVWIGTSDVFWYQQQTEAGHRYVLVDAEAKSKREAFDHEALASGLSEAAGVRATADGLHLSGLTFDLDAGTADFGAFQKQWRLSLESGALEELESNPRTDPTLLLSPDGRRAVFAREHNLWLRDLESGEEKQLTTDGALHYAYGAVPAATGRPALKPEAVWSPDSKKIFTAQTDDRQVQDLHVLDFAPLDGSVRPKILNYKTAFPGDEHITGFRMTVIDVETGKQTAARYPLVLAARMNDTPFTGNRAWWDEDSERAWFVDIERGERAAHVVELDTATGATRKVMTENAEGTYLELGSNVYTRAAIALLAETDELVWYSERSGWAHLYLYDLDTGGLVRQLTQGDWLVRDLLGIDKENRQLYFSYGNKGADKDPYYRHIARLGLDDAVVTELSSSDADHYVSNSGDFGTFTHSFMTGLDIFTLEGLSPTGRYYVETIQRVDRPNRTIVRDSSGAEVMTVEEADVSRLPEDFVWPEPFQVTAADGTTPISGVLYRPSHFSAETTYPVIDYIYGGPQVSNVPESLFTGGAQAGLSAMTLAELGFVVVVIDGRGTTERSREFHEASYGAAETASNLEDHVAGIRQLAERYPYMDTDRVGIVGFSGGGYMTASAMLRFPDFFKVGVSGAGNHDQRLFWHSWGERYQGMVDGDNYLPQANLTYAKNLKGKLLFIHGMLDFGVHPGGLFQLTQALMNANKKFDLVLLPQAGHELPGYAMVRQWDYFVEHLAELEPPADFIAPSSGDLLKAKMMAIAGVQMPAPEAESEDVGNPSAER